MIHSNQGFSQQIGAVKRVTNINGTQFHCDNDIVTTMVVYNDDDDDDDNDITRSSATA